MIEASFHISANWPLAWDVPWIPLKNDLIWTTGFVSSKDLTFFCWSRQLEHARTHIHKAESFPKHPKIISLIKVSHLYHLIYKLFLLQGISKRDYILNIKVNFLILSSDGILGFYVGIVDGVFDLFISLDLWIIYSYWCWQTTK